MKSYRIIKLSPNPTNTEIIGAIAMMLGCDYSKKELENMEKSTEIQCYELDFLLDMGSCRLEELKTILSKGRMLRAELRRNEARQ